MQFPHKRTISVNLLQGEFSPLKFPAVVITTSIGGALRQAINEQWSLPLHFLI